MAAHPDHAIHLPHDAEEFASLARELHGPASVLLTLELMCTLAVSLVPGADHAGITIIRGGTFSTPASSDAVPISVDTIQYETGEGPCVDAAVQSVDMVELRDIDDNDRWPAFRARMRTETPVRAMLSYKLFLEADALGALNLYADSPGAFTDASRAVGQTFAAHGAIAFKAAQADEQIVNLQAALVTSRRIGQAVGILMCRRAMTEQAAFDLLRVTSQRGHQKLRALADDVVLTGDLLAAS
ncbi:MAG: GAF and ANTAR domain-containing protein [Actinomycetota bacterium]|nr:GAF and ANTAR domain-containing protein [Actinomycetota bacterium]